ncbi:MAG TPA: Rieske (2Fe-2S) protein [Actinomycetota bacterium]
MADAEGWERVIALDLVPDGKSTRAAYDDDIDVLLYRSGDRIFATTLRCTHQGAPLDRGPVSAGASPTVTCAAHGSMFDLETGKVMRGPAAAPLDVFDVRLSDDGMVELRPREA